MLDSLTAVYQGQIDREKETIGIGNFTNRFKFIFQTGVKILFQIQKIKIKVIIGYLSRAKERELISVNAGIKTQSRFIDSSRETKINRRLLSFTIAQ